MSKCRLLYPKMALKSTRCIEAVKCHFTTARVRLYVELSDLQRASGMRLEMAEQCRKLPVCGRRWEPGCNASWAILHSDVTAAQCQAQPKCGQPKHPRSSRVNCSSACIPTWLSSSFLTWPCHLQPHPRQSDSSTDCPVSAVVTCYSTLSMKWVHCNI